MKHKQMKINNCEQQTEEWFEARKGKMSSSNSQAVGANGKGLETYCKKIVMETLCKEVERYTNPDMERGNELEPLARKTYIIESKNKVEEVGLIEYNDFFVSSPDGLIDDNGMVEIKCMNDQNHFNFIIDGKIQSKWMWQMQGQLLASGRDWVDFVAYNPNFDKSLIVVRVEKDLVKQEKLIVGIEKGTELIKEIKQKYAESTTK